MTLFLLGSQTVITITISAPTFQQRTEYGHIDVFARRAAVLAKNSDVIALLKALPYQRHILIFVFVAEFFDDTSFHFLPHLVLNNRHRPDVKYAQA